jgi:hypothetical protein
MQFTTLAEKYERIKNKKRTQKFIEIHSKIKERLVNY